MKSKGGDASVIYHLNYTMITKISQAKHLDQSKLLAYHRIEQNDFAHQATSESFGSCLVGFLLCMLSETNQGTAGVYQMSAERTGIR